MARTDRGGAARLLAVVPAVVVAGCALLDGWYGDGWFLDGPWPLLGALAAGYLLGARLSAMWCRPAVAVVALALTTGNQLHDPGGYPVADDVVFFLLMVGGPAVAGAALSRRRGQIAELSRLGRRLEEQRAADLEAARLEERQRVEVSVHRRLIEQVGGLVLLAEGARGRPTAEAVTGALSGIEDGARTALADLREAVGTLRTTPAPVPDHAGPTSTGSRRAEPPPGMPDVALAAGIGLALGVETVVRDFTRGPGWVNVLVALVVAAPVAWRRTRPLTVLAATGVLGAAMTALLTPLPLTVTALALLLVTAYAGGAHARQWPSALVLSWGVAGAQALAAAGRDADGLLPTLLLSSLVVLAGVVAAGAAVRAETLRSRVAALARGREIEHRAAAAGTRLVLARELHDSVAQAMTVVCLQASAAQGPDSDRDAALATVLAAARDCMAELRSGLDRLDGEPGPLASGVLHRLADASGLDIEWHLDPAVDTTGEVGPLVERVLREALTNAARHAPGSRVGVRVEDIGGRLEVEVVDDGAGRSGFDLGTGTGLAGLREELARHGGTLTAGPRAGSGFRLTASLPRRREVPA